VPKTENVQEIDNVDQENKQNKNEHNNDDGNNLYSDLFKDILYDLSNKILPEGMSEIYAKLDLNLK